MKSSAWNTLPTTLATPPKTSLIPSNNGPTVLSTIAAKLLIRAFVYCCAAQNGALTTFPTNSERKSVAKFLRDFTTFLNAQNI